MLRKTFLLTAALASLFATTACGDGNSVDITLNNPAGEKLLTSFDSECSVFLTTEGHRPHALETYMTGNSTNEKLSYGRTYSKASITDPSVRRMYKYFDKAFVKLFDDYKAGDLSLNDAAKMANTPKARKAIRDFNRGRITKEQVKLTFAS